MMTTFTKIIDKFRREAWSERNNLLVYGTL